MRRLTFEKGDHVYELEDPSHSIFLVRAGKVDLVTTYPETGEGIDSTFGPGKVFGEVEIVDGRARTATAKAASRSVLLELDREELMDILFKKPEDSLVLSKSSYERLKALYSDESLDHFAGLISSIGTLQLQIEALEMAASGMMESIPEKLDDFLTKVTTMTAQNLQESSTIIQEGQEDEPCIKPSDLF